MKRLLLVCLLIAAPLFAEDPTLYLIPHDHPAKPTLDALFGGKRVTATRSRLKKAKFHPINHPGPNTTTTLTHKNLKGYVIKLVTDDIAGVDTAALFSKRVRGANLIRETIEKEKLTAYFKVPHKWLYPLPYAPEKYILLAEDMNIVSFSENKVLWRSPEVMTRDRLEAVFRLIAVAGLSDSIYPFNIPFSYDGKIAVIDTEYFQNWCIPYHKLTHKLPPALWPVWESLYLSLERQGE